MHRFSQVDVFTDRLTTGNPLAVVHDADDLTDEQLAAIASWTNLSETTFLLRPKDRGWPSRLAFAAPPRLRSGPVAAEDLAELIRFLGVDASDVLAAQWVDNGPGWVGVLLRDAATVLAVRPTPPCRRRRGSR